MKYYLGKAEPLKNHQISAKKEKRKNEKIPKNIESFPPHPPLQLLVWLFLFYQTQFQQLHQIPAPLVLILLDLY
jgi:hypothetical protein